LSSSASTDFKGGKTHVPNYRRSNQESIVRWGI
jgi:hypothetical protein